MAVTLANITTLVRALLGDYSHTQTPGDIFTYANSSVFTISEINVITASTVLKNAVELDSGEWSYDSDLNQVTVSASLTTGDTVEIRYTYYPNYSDTEIQSYITAAVVQLSVNNLYTWTIENSTIYPEPEVNEKNLIAVVTALLMEPDNRTYRLPDVTINNPTDLPTDQKIRKTVAFFKSAGTHGIFDIL